MSRGADWLRASIGKRSNRRDGRRSSRYSIPPALSSAVERLPSPAARANQSRMRWPWFRHLSFPTCRWPSPRRLRPIRPRRCIDLHRIQRPRLRRRWPPLHHAAWRSQSMAGLPPRPGFCLAWLLAAKSACSWRQPRGLRSTQPSRFGSKQRNPLRPAAAQRLTCGTWALVLARSTRIRRRGRSVCALAAIWAVWVQRDSDSLALPATRNGPSQ